MQVKQVKVLTLCFSHETLTIVDNLSLTTEQMNDVPKTGRHESIYMYADDTTLYTKVETAEQAMEALCSDAQSTLDLCNRQNWLIVNLKKTHLMVFGRKHKKGDQ